MSTLRRDTPKARAFTNSRGGSLKRSAVPRRKSALVRQTPIRKVNPKRKAKLQAEQFGLQAELCRHLPCCSCHPSLYDTDLRALLFWTEGRQSDPHHSPTVGNGGKDGDAAPACRMCHNRLDSPWMSERALEEERGMNFRATAARLRRYLATNPPPLTERITP